MSDNEHLLIEDDDIEQIESFRIIETMRVSSTAAVYLAQKAADSSHHLLEVVPTEANLSADERIQLANQLSALAQLKGAEEGDDSGAHTLADGRLLYATPAAQGALLSTYLQQNQPLTELAALRLLQQIAEIISALHQQDIYPQALTPDSFYREANGRLHLIGLAVDWGAPAPAYRAPELQPGEPADAHTNIYSMGALAYTLLAGHPPQPLSGKWDIFTEQEPNRLVPLADVRPGLHPETIQFVRNCLWRQAWSRFDTAADLAAAITSALHTLSQKKKAAETAVLPPQLRDSKTLWIASAAVVLVLMIVAGLLWQRAQSTADATAVPGIAVVDSTATPFATPTPPSDSIETPVTSDAALPASTETAVATATSWPPIDLLLPANDGLITALETIEFRWRWPGETVAADYFELALTTGSEPFQVTAVTNPTMENDEYQFELTAEDLAPGSTYRWQLSLHAGNGRLLQESNTFTFRYDPATAASSSTPAASTATPTPSATPTESATPESTQETACTPTIPTGWDVYTIQADDTLFELATEAGLSVEQVMAVNCLTSDALSIDQRIYLPVPITPTPTEATAPPPGENQPPAPTSPSQPSAPPTARPTSTPPPVQP